MPTDVLTFQFVAYVGSAIGIVVAIVLYIGRRFAALEAELAKRDLDLAAHKLYAAETFVTRVGLKESLDHVHDALKGLTDRIDQLLNLPLRSRRAPPQED